MTEHKFVKIHINGTYNSGWKKYDKPKWIYDNEYQDGEDVWSPIADLEVEGWELVAVPWVHMDYDTGIAIFKRDKKEDIQCPTNP